MVIKTYNSLTRKKEEFVPLKKGQVGMYVCGPTVYDEPHIGHLRSAYVFDVVRRYLIYKGYKVNFVRNVTDVDDKIINKAREEYPSEKIDTAVEKVSVKYLESYHKAVEAFGIMPPDKEPKATKYIEKMQKFIDVLIDKGAAYQSGGDVYFDIKKAKDYGKLSNQSLEAMEAGARVAPGENKKDPLDFALWKAAKEGEPSWPSPWGNGRPGWHIECSVMSSDTLGDEFDIHGGGLDLIFPHHENEIAQSESAGNKFAKYWMHHGLLTINGQKMAKSLGNFITVKDFIDKYKNTDLLKLFFLSAHYSHPMDYSEEKIDESYKAIQRFEEVRQKITETKMPGKKNITVDFVERRKNEFMQAMDDDFNMPKALSSLFELVSDTNKFIDTAERNHEYYASIEQSGIVLMELLRKIFGLSIKTSTEGESREEALLLDEYLKARAIKDYKKSDAIREKLIQMGFVVRDTKDSTTWRRKI